MSENKIITKTVRDCYNGDTINWTLNTSKLAGYDCEPKSGSVTATFSDEGEVVTIKLSPKTSSLPWFKNCSPANAKITFYDSSEKEVATSTIGDTYSVTCGKNIFPGEDYITWSVTATGYDKVTDKVLSSVIATNTMFNNGYIIDKEFSMSNGVYTVNVLKLDNYWGDNYYKCSINDSSKSVNVDKNSCILSVTNCQINDKFTITIQLVDPKKVIIGSVTKDITITDSILENADETPDETIDCDTLKTDITSLYLSYDGTQYTDGINIGADGGTITVVPDESNLVKIVGTYNWITASQKFSTDHQIIISSNDSTTSRTGEITVVANTIYYNETDFKFIITQAGKDSSVDTGGSTDTGGTDNTGGSTDTEGGTTESKLYIVLIDSLNLEYNNSITSITASKSGETYKVEPSTATLSSISYNGDTGWIEYSSGTITVEEYSDNSMRSADLTFECMGYENRTITIKQQK